MAYTPHTWQANELVTPEKLNAIEIGLGNTISNSGSNTINGNLTTKGIYIDPTNSESNAFLLLRRPEGTNGANINFSRTTSNLQFTLYPTDYEASKNNYCTYYIESAPTGASSSSSRKILSTANIANDLTSTSTTDVLSAAMGKQLNDSKLSLSGGTLTGGLTTSYLYVKGGTYFHTISGETVAIRFSRDATTSNIMTRITTSHNGQFAVREYPTDNTDQTDSRSEIYRLPSATTGRTTEGQYSILTSKDLVTIAQGGTGASTAAAARTNLGITPANIGALALSGGTITGTLRIINSFNLYFLREADSIKSGFIHNDSNGRFYFYAYPATNTDANDHNNREYYYLPVPDTGRTETKGFAILTSKNLVTVQQGGTGKGSFASNQLLCGNGTNAIAELGSTGTSGQFLKSNGDAKPSWVNLTADLIPSLNASKITAGTLTVSRGGTGVSTASANYVFAGPSDKAGAPSFRKLQAVDIPSLTKSKISDIDFGYTTIAKASQANPLSTVVPNKRGIVIISRGSDQAAIAHVTPSNDTPHIVGTMPTGIAINKTSSTGLTVTNTVNDTIRVTWFLID